MMVLPYFSLLTGRGGIAAPGAAVTT